MRRWRSSVAAHRRDPMQEVDLLLLVEDEMTRNFSSSKQASTLPLACVLALVLTLVGTLAHAIHPRDVQSPTALSSLDQAFSPIGPLTLQAP
jgi:hypothetical protein